MRNLLLKFHLYGGLLCSSYLIIFGISSLNFNHHFGKEGEAKIERVRPLPVRDSGDDGRLCEAIRDSLGLSGWPLPWETYRDEAGNLHFGMVRPGRKYTIHALFEQEDQEEGELQIEEIHTGLWSVVTGLHGFGGGLPGSKFMEAWGIYTEVCVWVVLFSAGSGIYLWTSRRSERLAGLIVLGAGSGGALLFMIYVWLWG